MNVSEHDLVRLMQRLEDKAQHGTLTEGQKKAYKEWREMLAFVNTLSDDEVDILNDSGRGNA